MPFYGTLIKKYRDFNNLTQNEFLEKINNFSNSNVDVKTLSDWENSKFLPNYENRLIILKFIYENSKEILIDEVLTVSNKLNINNEKIISGLNQSQSKNLKIHVGKFILNEEGSENYDLMNIKSLDIKERSTLFNLISNSLYTIYKKGETRSLSFCNYIDNELFNVKITKFYNNFSGYFMSFLLNDDTFDDLITFKKDENQIINSDFSNENLLIFSSYSLTPTAFSIGIIDYMNIIFKNIKTIKRVGVFSKTKEISKFMEKVGLITLDENISKENSEIRFYHINTLELLSTNFISKLILPNLY